MVEDKTAQDKADVDTPVEDRASIELVQVRVGIDRLRAQLIVEACRDQGITGKLLVFDEGPSNVLEHNEHRFVVRAEDEPAVLRVIGDLHPELSQPR